MVTCACNRVNCWNAVRALSTNCIELSLQIVAKAETNLKDGLC